MVCIAYSWWIPSSLFEAKNAVRRGNAAKHIRSKTDLNGCPADLKMMAHVVTFVTLSFSDYLAMGDRVHRASPIQI